jgi:branched-chain amino acid transport system substrate-binding protein
VVGGGISGALATTSSASTHRSAHKRAVKSTWVINSLVDETGTDAAGGAAQKAGINWYVGQINKAGGIDGHHIELHFCDTQSTPTGAAQCAQQAAGDNTHVVLVQSIDPATRGALPYLTKDVVIAVDPILYPTSNTKVFQATGSSKGLLLVFAKAAKAARMHTVGVLYTTDTSGTHQLASVQEAAAAVGLKVVSAAQTPGVSNVTPQLLQLRQEGANVIYLASVGTNTAAAVNSYATLGMSLPIVAGAAAVTDGFLRSLAKIPPKLYGNSQLLVTTTGLPARTVKVFDAYMRSFRKVEHEPADTQTTSAVYDGCVALNALKAAGPNVARLVHYLKTRQISCLGSSMRFNLPGLNVINNQPSAMAKAPRNPNAGWQPVKGKL